jgi:hypothetical protein
MPGLIKSCYAANLIYVANYKSVIEGVLDNVSFVYSSFFSCDFRPTDYALYPAVMTMPFSVGLIASLSIFVLLASAEVVSVIGSYLC